MKKKLVFATILFCLLQNWAVIQAQKPSNMSAVFGAGGRFEVFVGVSGDKGGVYHTWQTSQDGSWNPVWTTYSPAPDDNPHGLVAGKDGDGRMIVAWITDGNIYVAEARYTDASLLHQPEPIFRPAGEADGHIYKYTYLTIANNSDGMIEIFALNERGRVYSFKEAKQDDSKSYWSWQEPFTQPHLIGGGDLQNISVTKFNDKLAIAGTGKDGHVWLKEQIASGVWDPNNDQWTPLNGTDVKEAYIQESKDHQLEVVALGSDENLYLKYQSVGSNSWNNDWISVINQQTNIKFAPSIFFQRFNDGSLFIVAHEDAGHNSLISNATQYVGSFGKTFQLPNNGGWLGNFFFYTAVTTHQSGVNTADDLGFLSPNAFAVAADAKGVIHYFSCYRVLPRVEHYIDFFGASSQRSLTYVQHEHEIPDFPWQYSKE